MNTTIFVLGASDPEMEAIGNLARAAGARVLLAAAKSGDGPLARVHPGNAYGARWLLDEDNHNANLFDLANEIRMREITQVVLVECGGATGSPFPGSQGDTWTVDGVAVPVVRVDHHRPGDPGYGRPPEEFLPASSLGQCLSLMSRADSLPSGATSGKGSGGLEGPKGTIRFSGVCWLINDEPGHYECLAHAIRGDLVYAAAADHCLEAAYHCRCPGVDPDALMQWRSESRAAFQKRPVEAVLADVAAARAVLLAAPKVVIHEESDVPMEWGDDYALPHNLPQITARDLRGHHVPELPEAAAREGLAFLAEVTDRDGRRKVVLQAATPETVRRFLDRWAPANGLTDTYGDPARGFAGGYLS